MDPTRMPFLGTGNTPQVPAAEIGRLMAVITFFK
jgi:hypothetical protein